MSKRIEFINDVKTEFSLKRCTNRVGANKLNSVWRINARRLFICIVLALCCCNIAKVKAQAAAIDGINIGFMESTPPDFNGWTAKTGTYSNSGYGVLDTPPFSWTNTYNDPSTATFSNMLNSYSAFVINTTPEIDENTNGGLNKIPTDFGFARSVRLGATNVGGKSAELSYKLKINDTNSLLTFCYAIVLFGPHYGLHYDNPTFEIDIVDNSDNLLKECLFFQNCGDVNSNKLPQNWHLGNVDGSNYGWIYLDWQQITVNLKDYLNDTVKLRIRVSGCVYGTHAGYAYFAAKTSTPNIAIKHDPIQNKVFAEAPEGFAEYSWFKQDYNTTSQTDLDNFYTNNPTLSKDSIFDITEMINSGDTMLAVRLTTKTERVYWDTIDIPLCYDYIPIVINKTEIDKLPKVKMLSVSICDNETYDFNGKELSETGIYTDTLTTSNGGDSIIILNLTVNTAYDTTIVVEIAPDEVYIFNGDTLSTSGTYTAHYYTETNCDSIVTVQLYVKSSLSDIEEANSVIIYPNPAKDKVTIEGEGDIIVTNNFGQVVYKTNSPYKTNGTNKPLTMIDVSNWESGIYYVKVGDKIKKLVIE